MWISAGGLTIGAAALAAVIWVMPVDEPGSVLFVDDNALAGGDGATWDTAYRFLQDALARASEGGVSEIHVAQGTYKPDQDEANPKGTGDREATFQIVNNIALMGGYAGVGADDPDARDIELYETILSGDLLGNDGEDFENYEENSSQVLSAVDTGEQTVLDGFTITSGSDEVGSGGKDEGGGLLVEGGQLHVLNSVFKENLAEFGGAVHSSSAELTFVECKFIGNLGTYAGGGIRAAGGTLDILDCVFDGNVGQSRGGGLVTTAFTNIIRSSFTSNSASHGGGIATAYAGPLGVFLELTDCTFQSNTCAGYGAAIRHPNGGGLIANGCSFIDNISDYKGGAVSGEHGVHTYSDCVISGNTANTGGAFYNAVNTNITFIDCEFSDNYAVHATIYNQGPVETAYYNCTFTGNGVMAVYEFRSSFLYRDCVFIDNLGGSGAAVHIYDHQAEGIFLNCLFRDNYASIRGGALFINGSNSKVINCTFISNSTDREAGAVGCAYGSPEFYNCRFMGNSADEDGGAIYISHGATPEFFGCFLAANTTELGGAIHVANYSGATFTNSAIVNNTASINGGGVAVIGESATASLANCILWQNYTGGEVNESTQIFLGDGSTVDVDYSCVEYWSGDLGGTGNIGDDPLFIDPDGPDDIPGTEDDDYHFSPGSPCIDAADNTAVAADEFDLDEDNDAKEPIPFDLDGNPRFVDDPGTDDTGNGTPPIIDMGAYEFQIVACPWDVNGDGVVDHHDLLEVVHNLGVCDDPDDCPWDVNGDGIVNGHDVAAVATHFGPCP